jgi:hypothetical protein
VGRRWSARGQNVQQESTNEFDGVDGHEFLAISVGGVSPPKCNLAILQARMPDNS